MVDQVTNIDLPLGLLNNIGAGIQNKLTERADSSAALRDVQKMARSPRIFKNITKFKAIVLRIKHTGTGPGKEIGLAASKPSPASWADRIFSPNSPTQLGSDSVQPGLIQIWARIPELHAALTPPSAVSADPLSLSDQDNWLIDQHDVFTAESTSVPLCSPGDIVWVNYGNKANFTDPIYLGPILDQNIQKALNSSANSAAGSYGSGCGDSPIKGSSPSGDTLPGKNAVATISAPEFLKHSDTQKYIWWLYQHQVKHLPAIRNWWVSGGKGNHTRLKAYIVWRAGELIKELGAEEYVPTNLPFVKVPSHEKYGGKENTHAKWTPSAAQGGKLEHWQTLAQVVWGVFYRECRHNPVGIMGNHPKKAFKHNNDTGYGMHQAIIPRFDREKLKNSKDDKYGGENTGILDGVEHWNMLDPKKGIDFVLAAYLRLFRKYGKKSSNQKFATTHGSFEKLMQHGTKNGGKNHFMLGVWWAGSREFKYKRKYNDIRLHGGKILDDQAWSTDYEVMAKNILGSETKDLGKYFDKSPTPDSPPGGGKDSKGAPISSIAALELWKQTFTGTITPKTTDPDEKVKSKGGAKSQLPSTQAPEATKTCHDLSGDPQWHPRVSRGPEDSTAKEVKILDVDSPFKKGAEFNFRPKEGPRKTPIDQIVIHESIGTSGTPGVVKSLLKRGLGTHFIIDRAGGITQHGAVEKILSHAMSNQNKRSVAIEIDNPFYGSRADKSPQKSPVFDLKWMYKFDKGRGKTGFLTNTGPQMVSLYKVVKWIFKKVPTIAQKVPGQRPGEYHLMAPAGKKFAGLSGVIPHCWGYNPHGDGWFATCYMFHRLNLGLNHAQAYDRTLNLVKATGMSSKKPRWIPLA